LAPDGRPGPRGAQPGPGGLGARKHSKEVQELYEQQIRDRISLITSQWQAADRHETDRTSGDGTVDLGNQASMLRDNLDENGASPARVESARLSLQPGANPIVTI
jgi:hypothetical protein